MKCFNIIIAAVLSAFSMMACQPDGKAEDLEYKIVQQTLEFPNDGAVMTLNVQTKADVKVESAVPWCVVSDNKSASFNMAKFEVRVEANDGIEARNTSLAVTVGGKKKETVAVVQEGSPLYVEKSEVVLDHEAQTFTLKVAATGQYEVDIDGSWIDLVSKTDKAAEFSVEGNNLSYGRNGTITFRTSKASHEVAVVQEGYDGPAPEPDMTGMESDAMTLMKKMTLGINLGNTLEAIGGETAWGAPRTTEDIILYFKELGFNAIRVPCSWDQNLEEGDGYIVKSEWMSRVKEVIDYIVGNDMYAVLNIHWDGGWLENDIPNGYSKEVDEQQKSIWTQIATVFRDYDEHLVFAGTNEPNVENAKHMETLLRYEQTFIDAVRATGGRNAYRVLVFQGPSTDINKSVELMKVLPEDKVKDRLAAEVHFYDPVQFCLLSEDASWGKMMYFWGKDHGGYATGAYSGKWRSDLNEDHVARQMAKMKKKFWDNGIPVIIGEFGASTWKSFNLGTEEENAKAQEGFLKSHAAYSGCVVKEAKANGCVPFYWHCEDDIIDRSGRRVLLQASYDALVEAGKTQYPD